MYPFCEDGQHTESSGRYELGEGAGGRLGRAGPLCLVPVMLVEHWTR